jgi:flagellar hook protein FlgE
MSNYNVAFSGLDNVSHAIDTVSNNIANANTVGYKAGQWVFADQFMKAASSTDVARAGMGAQNLSVRRPMIQGTLTTSANPLPRVSPPMWALPASTLLRCTTRATASSV